ncbi:Arsenate reductase and related proteins, glutaredoxin family [hydrothermal vent metagenome]|uniref:Arsenate reductase and related proteins, glutaredoxin family n=1 Tax=hydrothermal vent metagenome TaxID=652676 RepID=A0A1W1BAH5_9ZZZZ
MKIYGIKNCDTVKKTLKFFDKNGISYEFVDFKTTSPSCEDLQRWAEAVGLKKLFNTRSTTYRNLKLKELDLDDTAKIEWMCKEPLLIKRAIVESDQNIVVGYDEDAFTKLITKGA